MNYDIRNDTAAAAIAIALLAGMGVTASAQPTVRVSVTDTGDQAAGGTYQPQPVVSGQNANAVVFESPVSSLVASDTNAAADVFMAVGATVTRVLGNGSVQLNCAAQRPAVSGTGQFVAFDSCATNAIAGDSNGLADVFVLDRNTAVVTRVSVSTLGAQANGPSGTAAISGNGRYVAFISQATNLVAGVSGTQVYRHDRNTATTILISRVNGGGVPGNAESAGRPSVSDDGLVAFASDATNLVSGDNNGRTDVFVGDGATAARVSLSSAGGQLSAASSSPSISANGRLVAFVTGAPAVPADTNPVSDVYVRDRTGATTTLISRTAAGAAGNGSSFEPSISPAGSYVAFTSLATDIDGPFDAVLDVFVATIDIAGGLTVTGPTRRSVGSEPATGASSHPAIADNGLVAFASNEPSLTFNDNNGDTDVFLSSAPGVNQRLTVTAAGLADTYSGASSRPQPSFTGNVVAFLSSATNLVPGDVNGAVDVFVRDVASGTTTRLPVPPGYEGADANWVSISHDGRWVAYNRFASFLHDRSTGTTVPISVAAAGGTIVQGGQPKVSASGRHVAFVTLANLAGDDTNGREDVYVFDRITGLSTLASRTSAGGPGNGSSVSPGISGDGRRVVFASTSSNMAPGDANASFDVFVRDMESGTTTWVSSQTPIGGFDSRDPSISTDGRFVSFLHLTAIVTIEGTAPSRVYIARSDGAGTPRGSLSALTEGAFTSDDAAYDPTLSLFGRFLSFRSYKNDLVVGDTNGAADVFGRQVLDATDGTTYQPAVRVTAATDGTAATGGSPFSTENPEVSGNGPVVAFQSGFTTLVAGDTNGKVDAFARQAVFATAECQYYNVTLPGYTVWISSFGVDPCSDNGSPYADPDGDGFTNDQERGGAGDGNPILGAFTRYFAEGATKTVGLDFDVRLALANPNAFAVTGEISYQLPSGATVPVTPFSLAAYERATVLLDEQAGIAETGPDPSYEFATTVKATAAIGVDRTMTWNKSTYAGHAEVGVVSPSRTWYFAEGATIAGFNLFYLLQNPSAQFVTVEGRYLLGTGQTFTKSYSLPPNSRTNVWANVEQIGGGVPLASAEFSAVFTVTAGSAIIAERAMYRGSSPLFKAGHESAGITEPATEWFLAEGNAGQFFDMFVLIGNTTGTDAFVEAEFTLGTGTVYTKRYTVSRNSRFNIWVDQEELSGVFPFAGAGNTDVSIRIRSLNGVPLIVERAMWWPGDSSTWYEAHNSPATSRTSPRWVLGEGEAGGPLNWQTFVLVANTGDTAGQIQVRLLLPGGDTRTLTKAVDGKSRQTYPLSDLFAEAGLPVDGRAGVLVESVGTPLQLVVERAMYRNANGQTFIVGTNALGTPLP